MKELSQCWAGSFLKVEIATYCRKVLAALVITNWPQQYFEHKTPNEPAVFMLDSLYCRTSLTKSKNDQLTKCILSSYMFIWCAIQLKIRINCLCSIIVEEIMRVFFIPLLTSRTVWTIIKWNVCKWFSFAIFIVCLKFVFMNVNRTRWKIKQCIQVAFVVHQGRKLLGVNTT